MKQYLKSILYFLIPLFIVVLIYVCLDPFKVIWSYDHFYEKESKGLIGLNKDYVSTATFDHSYKEEAYNAFIFGNSRSIFYQVSDWKKFLPSTAKPFHFDASAESIYGIEKKIEYLDKQGVSLKHALLVLDYPTLAQTDSKKGHLFMISPQLVNYRNIVDFQYTYFKAFFTPKFLYAYFDFKLSGKVKLYMTKYSLIKNEYKNYEVKYNEERFNHFEKQIKEHTYYTSKKRAVFYKREPVLKYSARVIKEKQKIILKKIQHIFKKQGTSYKLIINPLYDQQKLNAEDLRYLKSLFGKQNVFDYSGINDFTEDYHNYYESSHYRSKVAREIMKQIYNVAH